MNEKTELSLYQSALKKHKETISDERNASNTESEASFPSSEASSPSSEASSLSKPGLRILCVGRIHKGKKTMIIAFPSERRKDHAAIPQGTEEKGET